MDDNNQSFEADATEIPADANQAITDVFEATETEQHLTAAAQKGEVADFRTEDAVRDDPAGGADWGPERTIRAESIIRLCMEADPYKPVHAKGIRIKGAKITGVLDLEAVALSYPLELSSCWFEKQVDLTDAQVKTLRLSGSRVPGILANRVTAKGTLYFNNGFVSTGEILMNDARIEGSIGFDGSFLENLGGTALDGNRLFIGGSFFLRNASVKGIIRLIDASFGGSLVCIGTVLSNPAGVSLDAVRIKIGGSIIFSNGSESSGELNLTLAQVGGNLECEKATISKETGDRVALRADGISTKGAVLLRNGFRAKGAVRLAFGRIGSVLHCDDAIFDNPGFDSIVARELTTGSSITLRQGSKINGTIQLSGANVGGAIDCLGTVFTGSNEMSINAARIIVKHDIVFDDGAEVKGQVWLVGSEVGGGLEFISATLKNEGKQALNADRINVKGHVYFGNEFSAKGAVRFVGARVGSTLTLKGSSFAHSGEVAFNGDGINTGNDVLLEGAQVGGELRLRNAVIGGDLDLKNAHFKSGSDGIALMAEGVICKGSVYLDEDFTSKGGILLTRARIEGELNCSGASLQPMQRRPDEVAIAFSASGIDVKGTLFWREMPSPPTGQVDMAGARVGQLKDDLKSWPDKHLVLDNFVYGSFDRPLMTTNQRLDWLRRQERFSPQPYEQVAQVLRRMGHERDARKIATAKQKDLRSRGNLSRAAYAWNLFLGITVGYGYQVWRALVISLIVIIIGAGIFELAFQNKVMIPVRDKPPNYVAGMPCPRNVPCFEPLVYSVDVFLPILDLRQDSYWLPIGPGPYELFYRIYFWMHIIIGWVLTTVGVAGLTGLVKKD